MKMLASNDRILADEIRSTVGKQSYPDDANVSGKQYVMVDRSRNYTYPDNIRATYNKEKKK